MLLPARMPAKSFSRITTLGDLALFSRSVAVCAMVGSAYFARKTMTQSLVYGNPYYCRRSCIDKT